MEDYDKLKEQKDAIVARENGLLIDALQACDLVCRLWSDPKTAPTPQSVNQAYEACRAVLQRANKVAKSSDEKHDDSH